MGPGESATQDDIEMARVIGQLIAHNKWFLLSGGREIGVMGAVSEAYKKAGGICNIGISPTDKNGVSEHVDLVISTNMHSGRNYINALSSDVIIAIGDLSSAGTLSEVALSLIEGKPFDNKPSIYKPIYLTGKGRLVEAIEASYKNAHQVTYHHNVMVKIKKFCETFDFEYEKD